MAILLQTLPSLLYAMLSVHFWRSRWHEPALKPRPALTLKERGALALVLAVHGWVLQGQLFPSQSMHFGFGLATAMMLWLTLFAYWIESFSARLEGLQALALPVAAVASVLPLVLPSQHILENVSSPAFRAHFVMGMLAYSLFTLAALHAMLIAVAERRLHSAHLTRALTGLPPLLTMEALLFRLIGVAFVLLTLTLISGIAFSESLFGKAFKLDHKTVFAMTSWLLFAVLLIGRHIWGWRGRKAVRLTLAGFVTLMLAYMGSRFVVEVILNRSI